MTAIIGHRGLILLIHSGALVRVFLESPFVLEMRVRVRNPQAVFWHGPLYHRVQVTHYGAARAENTHGQRLMRDHHHLTIKERILLGRER
jgi:hypothetical protein